MHSAELAERFGLILERHYEPGFGIAPAADPGENFADQLWVRDVAHAAAHFFIESDPRAVEDSIDTILRHQRADGSLPIRVERTYLIMQLIPGMRALARPLFAFFEKLLRGRTERPVYCGQDLNHAEDTIPAFLLLAELYRASGERGERFILERAEAIAAAQALIAGRIGPDGLICVEKANVDWADSISRGGEVGLINILWVEALRRSGDHLYKKARAALLERLYDPSGAYFRTTAGEERLDTAATVLGALFFLDAAECVAADETLERRTRRVSGLSNFDPPYDARAIRLPFKLIGHGGYHNAYTWPWVALQRVHLQLKIAREHSDDTVRARYRDRAAQELDAAARLFDESGGAYEIYLPESRTPARTAFYRPPRYFLASMAGFVSAQRALERLLQSRA